MFGSEPQLVARIALLSIALWVTAVWVAGAVYVVVSYIDSLRRLPTRTPRSTALWVARECWNVLWTQPLLPFFQLFGGKLGTGGGTVPVVLVHGYFQNRVDFLYIAHRLRRAGCGPIFAFNFFWPQSIEASSRQMREYVERVCEATGSPAVDLVTHSTGGLFALDLIDERPELVRRVATIGIPARGVPWKGPVIGRSGSQLRAGSLYQSQRTNVVNGAPVLSIYSLHDNLVHPAQTSELEGERVQNVALEGPGHLSVLFDRRVGDLLVSFLLPPQGGTAGAEMGDAVGSICDKKVEY